MRVKLPQLLGQPSQRHQLPTAFSLIPNAMLLYLLRQRQHQRRSALHPFQRPVSRNFDRLQQIHYAQMFALGQNLQPSKMQIPLENRTALEQASEQDSKQASEQVSLQRQMQANHLMLRLSDFTQHLQQQTADLLCQQNADRALLAEQISRELSEFHTNLTTVVAALRYLSQQQIPEQPCQPELQQLQFAQDLADFIALSQAEVKNQLIELSLIRKAQSWHVQQMLQSSPDRRLADTAELLADLQSFCHDLSRVAPSADSDSARSNSAG